MNKLLSMVIIFLFVLIQISPSQTVENYLKDITENNTREYMKSYLQPFSTALGTSLGGSLYHRGYTKGFPRFDVGVSMAYVMIPDEDRTFRDPVLGSVPTIFGGGSTGVNGFDKGGFLLPVLHANVGLISSLEATGRFTKINIDYLGDLLIYGAGLKYGLSDFLPLPLLDFSVQAIYHKFTLGDLMDAGTFSMNVQASIDVPVLPLDIYGGIGFDNSSLIVKTAEIGGNNQDWGNLNIEGENGVRFTVGASYTLLFFNLHADYNIGTYNSLGAGLMIVL